MGIATVLAALAALASQHAVWAQVQGAVRLYDVALGSSVTTSGLLQVYTTSSGWGTVCDDGWTPSNTRVVCSQLGFVPGSWTSGSTAGSSFPIVLDDVQCNGGESSLLQCPSNALFSHNCGHSEDVYVTCATSVSSDCSSYSASYCPSGCYACAISGTCMSSASSCASSSSSCSSYSYGNCPSSCYSCYSSGTCVSSASSCPSSSSSCSSYSYGNCPSSCYSCYSSGTCMSSSLSCRSNDPYNAPSTDFATAAQKVIALNTGLPLGLILAAAVVAVASTLFCVLRAVPPTPTVLMWPQRDALKQRAHLAWKLSTAAAALLWLAQGLLLSACIVPWYIFRYTYYTGVYMPFNVVVCGVFVECTTFSYLNESDGAYVAFAIISLVALVLLIVGTSLATVLARRIRVFAVTGALPPQASCCCLALPSAEGNVWSSFMLALVSLIGSLTYFSIDTYNTYGFAPGAGPFCLGFAVLLTVIGAGLLSGASCRVWGLPHVGAPHCCGCGASVLPRDASPATLASPSAPMPTGAAKDSLSLRELGLSVEGGSGRAYSAGGDPIVPGTASARPGVWLTSADGCTAYTWCCTYCAAADVAEAVEPGSWCSYFWVNFVLACCLSCGGCIISARMLNTRRELARRNHISDDVGFCGMLWCSPCYLSQELGHLDTLRTMPVHVPPASSAEPSAEPATVAGPAQPSDVCYRDV